MNNQQVLQAPAGRQFKFPQAQQLVEAMTQNLKDNGANPEGIQAQQDARNANLASGGQSQQSQSLDPRIAIAKAAQK